MADQSPREQHAGTKQRRGGKGLSARWHGVPIWLLALGGGAGVFLVYRWYKDRQAASSSTTSTATPTTAATGTSGLGTGYSGLGMGGYGGGGGGYGAANNGLLQQIASDLASGSAPSATTPSTAATPTPATPAPSAPTSVAPLASPVANTPGANITTPTQAAAGEVAGVPQRAGSTTTGAGGNPTGTAGVFSLPHGKVVFQPTAAVRRGGQVAYGIGNEDEARAAERAGGQVVSGQELMSRGWAGLTPKALYLVR